MISHRFLRVAAVFAVCLLGISSGEWGQRVSGQGELGWVGLFTTTLVEWLENANRVNGLCSHETADSPQWRECRDEKLTPKQYVIEVRSTPKANAASKGAIVVVATPGRGLRAYYRPAAGQALEEFAPDLLDVDWDTGLTFIRRSLSGAALGSCCRPILFGIPHGSMPARSGTTRTCDAPRSVRSYPLQGEISWSWRWSMVFSGRVPSKTPTCGAHRVIPHH